ncbi:flagellar biosynthetic protein FliO [Azoarcus sp. TTM-91]|uniref:flagellar biosynthetic protein FliO n=1 Tax=Azoarcus sp. TTM-91 TaxID=2691581 RepID=UPI00145F018B|nr:flagellar biosynthetic protein FliO [Azoarcus sp. TTM-91]NMG33181.1 flagellar biosynthetic protein FliO [Azoarcus sp. TTM-91]
MALPAVAADPALPAPAPLPTADLASNVGQMIFGLVIVIALLVVCLWLIKRLGAPRGSAAALKVLGAAPVGPRERVVLVELGEKVLVLGVAPGNVRTLHVMDKDELPPAAAGGPAAFAGKDFAGWLKQSLERGRNAG